MLKSKKLWTFLAAVMVIAIVGIARKPAPLTGISREEAIEIVIEKIAKPSKAVYGLRAHIYPDLLPEGSTVVPFKMWVEGKEEFVVCDGDCWFFWVDDDPLAHFAHMTRFVFVDAVTGDVMVKEAEWWPVVNGKVMWGTAAERQSDKLLIYEMPVGKIQGEPVVA